jgi:RNA polymerase sigma-70 factor (ECF subfamily)
VNVQERDAEWATWMRAAINGDAGAYRRFLISVTSCLRSMARSRCRAAGVWEGDAEDIVQEVLLAIHLKRSTWDPSRPIGPWIATISRNKFVDALRRRGRHVVVPIDDIVETLGAEEKDDGLWAREIDVLLSNLKTQHRQIVQSISINGHSVRETAARLEMKEGAVRVSLHRALKTLAVMYRSEVS